MRWRVSTSGLAPSGLGWPITEVVEPTADDAEGLGWPATEPSPGAVAASREPSDGAFDEGIPTSRETFSRETAAGDVSRETSASPEASECASPSSGVTMAVAEAALAETAGWESANDPLEESVRTVVVSGSGTAEAATSPVQDVPRETPPAAPSAQAMPGRHVLMQHNAPAAV